MLAQEGTEEKKGKKRTRTCVPRWPMLPGTMDQSNRFQACNVWPDEELTWPDEILVHILLPHNFNRTIQSMYITPCSSDTGNGEKNQVQVDDNFWEPTNKLPIYRDSKIFTMTRRRYHSQVLSGLWKFTLTAKTDFYFCYSDNLKFEFEWEAQWPDIAKARQQHWGTQPSQAVPSFMKHLESLAGRFCHLSATQLRLMGYPILGQDVATSSNATGILDGCWYCQPRPLTGTTMTIGDGFLVHPSPMNILAYALSLGPIVVEDKPRCTLVIHETVNLLTSVLTTLASISAKPIVIETLEELAKLDRKSLKRGGLTLIVRHSLLRSLPPHPPNEFAQYNVRKKTGLPTLFSDIEWGRLILIVHEQGAQIIPTLKCSFMWTLCIPTTFLQINTGKSQCPSWLELNGEWRCNRHRALQFV